MSIKAVAWAGDQSVGDPMAKLVLIALCEYYNEESKICYPGVKTLTKWADCSERTVQRKLRKLADEGWIEISGNYNEIGRQTSNIYRITAYEEGRQPDGVEGVNCVTPYKNHNKKPIKEKNIQKRKTSLPEPWKPDERYVNYALERGWVFLKIKDQLEDFELYHKARDNKFVDWYAAWRTWVRNDFSEKKKKGADRSGLDAIDEFERAVLNG